MQPKNKFITDINVIDVERLNYPSKHYVYCINVTWSGSKTIQIFRRYSQFFELQSKLCEQFRDIPTLTNRIILGRISSVAVERKNILNDYCKKLIDLRPEISSSKTFLEFFEKTRDDCLIKPQSSLNLSEISLPFNTEKYICIHDFQAISKTEISLSKNQVVNVHVKNLNGWWFVSLLDTQGYVPQSVLRPLDGREDEYKIPSDEFYSVIQDYDSKKDDEISIKRNEAIRVVEKNLDGWWMVERDGEYGLTPAVCLSPLDNDKSIIFSICSRSTSSFSSYESNSSLSSDLNEDEFYYVAEDHRVPLGEGLSLRKGQRCRLLNTDQNDWSYVYVEECDSKGWIPSVFLTKEKVKPRRDKIVVDQILNPSQLLECDSTRSKDIFEIRF